jgi:hypothetical protein
MRALIFLLTVCVFGYFWHYRRERYTEYEGLQTSIKTAEGNVAARLKEKENLLKRLEPLREAKKGTEAPDGSPDALQKEVDALKDSVNAATAQLDAEEKDFLQAVEAVRENAKKQTFPVLKLPSGQELKDCTITKFTDGYLNISHSSGVAKVLTEDLPEGWVEQYSLDYIGRDSKADREAIAARVERATTAPLDLKTAKVSDIKARIPELEAQLLSLAAEMRNAKRESDLLIRQAYQIALEKGPKGQAVIAKRKVLFDKSKKVDSSRSEIQGRYKKLREEKLALERQLVELTKRPGT